MIKEVIIATITDEQYLGDNFKNRCINYINNLEQENKELKEEISEVRHSNQMLLWAKERADRNDYKSTMVLDEIREYINNYDVFKEFSFPLMKRDEESQVKSSIDYEFQTSIKKSLLKILDKVKE